MAQSFGGGSFGGGGAGGSYGDDDTGSGLLSGKDYDAKYKGAGAAGMCSVKTQNKLQAQNLIRQSIDVNLDKLEDNLIKRVETWAQQTSKAISYASGIDTNNFEHMKAEVIDAMDKSLKLEQVRMIDQKTLEATRALKPSPSETKILSGLSYYRPELPIAFRQAEMERYINELNNVPLDNKFRESNGQPKTGYVDTSKGTITAIGQEFRNYIRLFCDVRSMNGQVAATKYLEYVPGSSTPTEYWCGQERGLGAPLVMKGPDNKYVPLTGNPLAGHVLQQTRAEAGMAGSGQGKIQLLNAAKNVSELYFEPRSLTVANQDMYEKAEQEFARMVIGRAGDLRNVSSLNDAEGQRAFMSGQSRVAKLALARYAFADMFSQKVPTLPEGSARWAADMIEENLGGCKNPTADYAQLCNLSKQLRAKKQISESEFFDVMFSRQFQGMAFGKNLVKLSEGQLKRLQTNLLGLQMALNYKRNRLKEQQLLLITAKYAQQAQ